MLDTGLSLFDDGTFTAMQRIAETLADSAFLPEHLRGTRDSGKFIEYPKPTRIANAMLVVNAARLWHCDPFLLAGESYVVHGSLDFEGKVYAAMANAYGQLRVALDATYEGDGDGRAAVITGTLSGEAEPRSVTITLVGARTKNQCWKDDPDQQLFYAGCRKWVRRHCPQVMLGLVEIRNEEAEEPLRVIEHKPETQARLEAAKPTEDYAQTMAKLNDAQYRHQVESIVYRTKGSGTLKPEEKAEIVEAAKPVWKSLPVAPWLEEEGPTEAFTRWERTVKTETRRDALMEHAAAIEDDQSLEDAERKELAVMISELIKETEPVA